MGFVMAIAFVVTFILGFLREGKRGSRLFAVAIPIAALISLRATDSMRTDLPWFYELIAFAFFCWSAYVTYQAPRQARLVFVEGIKRWWTRRSRYVYGAVFMWIPLVLAVFTFTDSEVKVPHFRSTVAWTCVDGINAKDASEGLFCIRDQAERDGVKRNYEAAVTAFRQGNYEPCLRRLNDVYAVTWKYENTHELNRACRDGLLKVERENSAAYHVAMDRPSWTPPPERVPSSSGSPNGMPNEN